MKRYCLMERTLRGYHDGSLNSGRQRRFEQHLHGCVPCTRQLQALEETDALLSRARPQTPELAPAAQDQLFRVALAASQTGFHRSPWQRRWRLATGIALVLGMFGGLARQQQSTAHGVVMARVEPKRSTVKQVADSQPVIVAKVEPPQTSGPRRSGRRQFGRRRSARALRWHAEPPPVTAVAAVEVPQVNEFTPGETLQEAPLLLVLATRASVTPTVNVTVSTSDEPGYATAAFTTITPFGTQVVTQATISSCTPDHPGAEPDETAAPHQTPVNEPEREDCDGMD
jgi:hypothetical protein